LNTFTLQYLKMLVYPIYRKLSNDKSFYRILSENEFEEIQCIGSTRIKTHIKAEKYPEILRIKEMVSCNVPFEQISEEEYYAQELA